MKSQISFLARIQYFLRKHLLKKIGRLLSTYTCKWQVDIYKSDKCSAALAAQKEEKLGVLLCLML